MREKLRSQRGTVQTNSETVRIDRYEMTLSGTAILLELMKYL